MATTIYYCGPCRYEGLARAAATALEKELGTEVEVRSGGWGCFRVEHDGVCVFDRWQDRGWIGRLGFGHKPTVEEIVERFRNVREAQRT